MLDVEMTNWLQQLLAKHGAVAGTLHVLRGEQLEISAAVNIPPKVQEITAKIPHGKGMAGLAWSEDRPIQTCNLKDDAINAQIAKGMLRCREYVRARRTPQERR